MAGKREETLASLRQQKAQAEKNKEAQTKDLASTTARIRDLDRQIAEAQAMEIGQLAMAAGLHLVDRAVVAEAFVWLGTVLPEAPADPMPALGYLRSLKGGKGEEE
jgi:hypothetical protein